MDSVKVSVIVPVYNTEKYLRKCLDSLVNQTLNEIEIIVVNDGSPDNSQVIIDEYAENYPNKIRSYIKENGGQGSARNLGLEVSRGEYIGYVDSDDWVEENMFEKLYSKAEKDRLDIVICSNYNVTESGDRCTEYEAMYFEDCKKNSFFGKMAVWNKLYSAKLLKGSGLSFRSKLWYEDLDFTVRILAKAEKVGYVNEPLYNYLLRQGSTMNNSNINRNTEILYAFDELINKSELSDYKDLVEILAIDHIYISTVVRIINADADITLKRKAIKKLLSYMNDNFPTFKKNEYIKILPKNRKIIYTLLSLKMYSFVRLLFKIKERK